MNRFAPDEPCLISCGGPFDGMVVVLRERSKVNRVWRIHGQVRPAYGGAALGVVHESWLIHLSEDAGVDEIHLVIEARKGSTLAASVLATKRTMRLQARE